MVIGYLLNIYLYYKFFVLIFGIFDIFFFFDNYSKFSILIWIKC